jgi:hypothetical protein
MNEDIREMKEKLAATETSLRERYNSIDDSMLTPLDLETKKYFNQKLEAEKFEKIERFIDELHSARFYVSGAWCDASLNDFVDNHDLQWEAIDIMDRMVLTALNCFDDSQLTKYHKELKAGVIKKFADREQRKTEQAAA